MGTETVKCYDPRHDTFCPDAENCSACMDECSTEFWVEPDGTPWGEVKLSLSAAKAQP